MGIQEGTVQIISYIFNAESTEIIDSPDPLLVNYLVSEFNLKVGKSKDGEGKKENSLAWVYIVGAVVVIEIAVFISRYNKSIIFKRGESNGDSSVSSLANI